MESVRELSPALAKRAAETINEDPKQLAAELAHLKEWISKQQHLRVNLTDQWLITFLRGCKHSLEKTKMKIDNFYTVRTLFPEFFKDRDFTKSPLKELSETCTLFQFENKTDPTGPSLNYAGQNYDPKKVDMKDLIKYVFVLLDCLMLDYDTCNISGFVLIIDMYGTTLSHFTPITPTLIKQVLTVIQDAYPVRLKSIHFINAPPAFDAILTIAKKLASEKLRKRFHLHRTLDSLYEHIPKASLPRELGGEGETYKEGKEKTMKAIMEHLEWIKEDEQNGSIEKLRVGKPKTSESLLGIDGSFRQLVID